MYNNHNQIVKQRKIEPDYSEIIPIAITVTYINPNGKIAFREMHHNDNNLVDTLRYCLKDIAQSTSTPPIIIE